MSGLTKQYGRPAVVAKHGRCGICLFADLEHAGTFECRRFPPAPYFEPTGKVSNIRPRVGGYYWCGEFQPDPDKDNGDLGAADRLALGSSDEVGK